MYPIFRLAKEMVKFRSAPALGLFDTHVSHHICWPWDLDPWMELNNGRTLTLFDLARLPYSARIGLMDVLRREGWGMAVAGASVRYRRRVRAFHRLEIRTRCLGWDERFIYLEHAMWCRGECTSHMLMRAAVTDSAGIVAPRRMLQAMGKGPESPPIPGWVLAWTKAEAARPWPPEA